MKAVVMIFAIAAGLLASSSPSLAKCLDVANGEPSSLVGILDYRIFAGPPNFEDVQMGDTPEPGYILKLDRPICLAAGDFSDPSRSFDEVQVVPLEGLDRKFVQLKNKEVKVFVHDRSPAETGHHHRPLVVWANAIEPVEEPDEVQFAPARTVVEAFYAALRAGDGQTAAKFVVPEKVRRGPFSAGELTKFYSSLDEPLKLISVRTTDNNRFEVQYSFRSASSVCNGSATVSTVDRGGRNFIMAVRSHTGC